VLPPAELEPRPDHASYLASWLEVLSSEKRFIFSAAAHAQRAVAYLHDQQPKAADVEEQHDERTVDLRRRLVALTYPAISAEIATPCRLRDGQCAPFFLVLDIAT
jgi:Zincin-like metallopeptidase